MCETGAARRTRLRGLHNLQKCYLIQAAAANLALVMRSVFGAGTPRGWAGRKGFFALFVLFGSMALRMLRGFRDVWERLLLCSKSRITARHQAPWSVSQLKSPGC